MVSPSKKQKSKSRDKVGHSSKKASTGASQQNRSRKPLCNKKFYLDLKSHVASSKLETNLKSLGATVELFLVREVNIVVTDRPQWTGGTSGSRSGSTPKCALPSPSPSFHTPSGACSGSPATIDSPGEGLGRRRTKSRAEAMLERARLQPQQTTIDPLDNAARWGIPIWPLEKIWKWLEKVYEKSKVKGVVAHAGSNCNSPKSKKFTAPYIKIDSVQSDYRPIYKEFPVWPSLNLGFPSIGSPFSPHNPIKKEDKNKAPRQGKGNCEKDAASKSTKHKPPDDSRMTRKARPRIHSEECGSAPLSGYCEICQQNYTDRKKHLQADSHIKFVNNDRNFLTLDTLIKQGSNMEAFLKMNGANDISQCTLFGNTRRSLRSVVRLHSLDASPSPPNSSSWKGLLSPNKKMSISSVSNGHHATRSTTLVMDQKTSPKIIDHKDNLEEHANRKNAQQEDKWAGRGTNRGGQMGEEDLHSGTLLPSSEKVQCNGISSPHCYGTRYGGRSTGERTSPTARRNSHWDEHPSVRARPQRTRTASASCYNTIEVSQLSPTGSDSGHHLRSRGQMWLPSNLLGTTAEDEGNPARSRLGQSPQGLSSQPQSAKTSRDSKAGLLNIVVGEDEHTCAIVLSKSERHSGEEAKTYHGDSQLIRKKRLTAEEKLIEDNRAYYKLEVKNSKLRSSGHYLNQRETDVTTAVMTEESKPPVPIAVKEAPSILAGNSEPNKPADVQKPDVPIKQENTAKKGKIRLSELSLLNNEAENFMFGEPVRKDSTDESSEDECNEEETATEVSKAVKRELIEGESVGKVLSENVRNANNKHSENVLGRKEDYKSKENPPNPTSVVKLQLEGTSQHPCNILQCDESSMGSIDTCSLASSCDTNKDTKRKKKRRTQAEAFIHDNLDYYKFEIPGSRLRFQGSMLPQTGYACRTTTGSEAGSGNKSKDNCSKNKESFHTEASCSGKQPTSKSKSKELSNVEPGGSGTGTISKHSKSKETGTDTISKHSKSKETGTDTISKHSKSKETGTDTISKHSKSKETGTDTISKHSKSKETGTDTISKHSKSKETGTDTTLKHSKSKETGTDTISKHSKSKETGTDTTLKHSKSKETETDTTLKHSKSKETGTDTTLKHSKSKETGTDTTLKHSKSKETGTDTTLKHSKSKETGTDTTLKHSKSKETGTDMTLKHIKSKETGTDTTLKHSQSKETGTDSSSKHSKSKESTIVVSCVKIESTSKTLKNKESVDTEPCCSRTETAIKDTKNDIAYSKESSARDVAGKHLKDIISEVRTKEIKSDQKGGDMLNDDGSAYKSSAMEGLHFSFEALPQSEPWYQTYQRQDDGEEFYLQCLSDSGYWKPFLLPYEMPPSELLNTSAGPSGIAGPSRILCSTAFSKKKRRRAVQIVDKKSRKSPRCHASTLAILSSLMRKRKEPDKPKEEDNLLKTIPGEEDDLSRDESTNASTSKAPVNEEFTSESDMDMREIAQNIDKMFLLCSEDDAKGNLPIVSDKEVQGDVSSGKPLKQKSSKSKKALKHQGTDSKTIAKKLEPYRLKESEVVDIDPLVLQQLALHTADPLACIPQPAPRCKGGPCMDVLTLLDGFAECHCMDDVTITGKECTNCEKIIQPSPVKESSCNSSECGASSTCETVTNSDVPETAVKIPSRKRKRKKNLTGWPVDKTKSKKRIPKKIDKGDENLPKIKEPEEKCNIVSEKLNNVLIEGNGSVEISTRKASSNTVNKESESDKCSKSSNDTDILKKSDKTGSEVGHDNLIDEILNKSVSVIGSVNKETVTSRDEVLGNISVVHESNAVDRRSSKDESVMNVYLSAEKFKTDKHKAFSRTVSLDASPSDLQPCVRVKKMENISDLHFLSSSSLSSGNSGIANNRRLRSASSSSFSSSSPIRKRHCSDADVKANSSPTRTSSRKKKLEGIWDSWSTRKRR